MKGNKNIIFNIFFWLVLILLIFVIIDSGEEIEWEESVYKVSANDTLYGIAAQYNQDTVDSRKYVHMLKDINNIEDSILNVGDEIKILIPKE